PLAAPAAEDLHDFKAPAEMTPEELEASKAASRLPVTAYSKQVSDQVTPIPWKAITLFAVILLIATPYALRYYRATAGEATPERKKSPSPSPSGRAPSRAYEEPRLRNTNPADGHTPAPVRPNARP